MAAQQPLDSPELKVVLDAASHALESMDDANAKRAMLSALGRLGGKALPLRDQLVSETTNSDSAIAASAKWALEKIEQCPITRMEKAGIPRRVQARVYSLLANDPAELEKAQAELVRDQASVTAALIIAAGDDQESLFPEHAATVLAQLPKADVLRELSPHFDSPNGNLRWMCVSWVSRVSWDTPPPCFEDAIDCLDVRARSAAKRSLIRLAQNCTGSAAQAIRPLLLRELKHTSEWSRSKDLVQALSEVTPEPVEQTQVLVPLLRDDIGNPSAYACDQLGNLMQTRNAKIPDPLQTEIFNSILTVLKSTNDEYTRVSCIKALTNFSSRAAEVLPILKDLKKPPNRAAFWPL